MDICTIHMKFDQVKIFEVHYQSFYPHFHTGDTCVPIGFLVTLQGSQWGRGWIYFKHNNFILRIFDVHIKYLVCQQCDIVNVSAPAVFDHCCINIILTQIGIICCSFNDVIHDVTALLSSCQGYLAKHGIVDLGRVQMILQGLY